VIDLIAYFINSSFGMLQIIQSISSIVGISDKNLIILLFVFFNNGGGLPAFVTKQDWAFSVLLRWVLIGLTIPASLLLILPRFTLKIKSLGLLSLYIFFLLFVISYGAEFDVLLDIMDKISATEVSQRLL